MSASRFGLSPMFVRFLVTGGIGAVVNLGSRYLLNFVMAFPWAVAVAYLFGMTSAYLLGRFYVFGRSGRTILSELWRFTLVHALAAAQVWLVSVGLAEFLFPAIGFATHPREVAHLLGVIAPIFTSYLGHRHFSFARG